MTLEQAIQVVEASQMLPDECPPCISTPIFEKESSKYRNIVFKRDNESIEYDLEECGTNYPYATQLLEYDDENNSWLNMGTGMEDDVFETAQEAINSVLADQNITVDKLETFVAF